VTRGNIVADGVIKSERTGPLDIDGEARGALAAVSMYLRDHPGAAYLNVKYC
jgi:hypothetical protein